MKSAFSNVDTQKASIRLQEPQEGLGVGRKGRGRPTRPNMIKRLVKVDSTLYRQMQQKAEEEHTTLAALLARAMRRELAST